jgi:hypothetical protein
MVVEKSPMVLQTQRELVANERDTSTGQQLDSDLGTSSIILRWERNVADEIRELKRVLEKVEVTQECLRRSRVSRLSSIIILPELGFRRCIVVALVSCLGGNTHQGSHHRTPHVLHYTVAYQNAYTVG